MAHAGAESPVRFSDTEKQTILLHGPWPVATKPDPSNRVSGAPAAIAFGRALFNSSILAKDRDRSCAACHVAAKGFGDGRPRSIGIARVDRNAPGLYNLRLNRWFGWGGKSDTLWSQSIHPILDAKELGATPALIARRIAGNDRLAAAYRRTFGHEPAGKPPETVLVNVAKALAAFQETIVSGRTPFDTFRDALAKSRAAGIAAYPAAAKRGLKIFIGKGKCNICHFGPNFTNGEFHNIGIGYFVARGRVDKGRYGGIEALKASRYNLLGPYNDDTRRSTAGFTRRVRQHPANWGAFRVPSLRNLVATAPYMHDGSKPTLREAVRHYSELNEDRLHQTGEKLLRALRLSRREIADLIAFLNTLSETPRRK
ncbi:MAG TPA: cytochrome c peroxidase [Alphaproteobacteria bacterium]|nr:cytochrome c peroxidase [Alphaproteobacteria bacterium]